jgi:tRNA(Ile)-lysidine synthase TilS/MesJ
MHHPRRRDTSAFLESWTSHPEYWFKQSDDVDVLVAHKYSDLLDTGDTCVVGDVVLYDQIPRHVYRREAAHHIVSYFLEKSLERLSLLGDAGVSGLPDAVWVFAMLPYRHKGVRTGYVIDEAWTRLDRNKRDGTTPVVIRRFIAACYSRVPKDFNVRHRSAFCFHAVSSIPPPDLLDVFEYRPYTETCRDSLADAPLMLDGFKRIVPKNSTVVVSLSGGVDSMVCLHNLYQMRDDITLVAVHVNYRNRGDTNTREEAFIEQWCDHHGIALCVLNLGEINRQRCADNEMRDMYERYTRDRRMAAYRQAARAARAKTDAEPADQRPADQRPADQRPADQRPADQRPADQRPADQRPADADADVGVVNVVLGHNRDDALENILTNVSHRSKYDNLHGMTDVSTVGGCGRNTDVAGIRILRPLLQVSKKAIIDYARLHRIPYFRNTTPVWAQRAQIRDRVVPALVRWDPNVIEGLHGVARELRDMHATVAALVRGVDWERIPKTDSLHFWSTLFGSREHIGRVSRRSLQNFIGKVERGERGVSFRVMLNRGTLLEVCVIDGDCVSVSSLFVPPAIS